ncbi:GTPase IMAP family member 8-like isoform X3 [Ctenopharyngodon idella]|uniref:GTPase IMAP family member 8-like isoform X3 n=1 Tax=Ctenopharyngodon idella TaxID=7959 RepID=UPI0022313DEF|nr:GTPase IMAP family member 8-like isoform X3 [Ctenopharyngodon idella]
MMDPNPDDILDTLPGEDEEKGTDDFNQTQHNPNNLEVLTKSKQNEFAEGPVLDDKETCGPVKKEVSKEIFDMQQTSVPVTSKEQTPKTEMITDHSLQANMSGRENQADNEHKSVEEKNNPRPLGHPDMIKTPGPSDSDMDPSLSFVLFGNSSSVQFGHENILLGEKQPNIENVAISGVVSSKRKISEHHVSVINMIDLHEAELYLDCMDHLINELLDENEIHAFIFAVRLGQLTDADKMGLEWLQRVFGDKVLQFVIILFTYEREEEYDSIIEDLKKNPVLEQLLGKCGGRYHTCNMMMNNQSEMRELMNKIEHLFHENKQQCYTGERDETQKSECKSAEVPVIRGSSESTTPAETEEQHMDNEQSLEEGSNSKPDGQADLRKTPEVCDSDSSVRSMDNITPSMTIVLFGNSSSVQFGCENILLGEKQTNMEKSEISSIIPIQRKISERHISVIDMIDLHETEYVDHLIRQLMNENEIHAFIFVVRLGQLTDADNTNLDWLQRVFGDKVLQFVIILFTYEREEEYDSIIEDLKKNPVLEQLLGKCGGRYHTCNMMMNNQSEMRELMNKIEHLFNENKQQCYTGERDETQKSECKSGEKTDSSLIFPMFWLALIASRAVHRHTVPLRSGPPGS